MDLPDRAFPRTPRSRILAGAAVIVGLLTALGAPGAQAKAIPEKCPSGASISAAAGVALKASKGEAAGGLRLCTYSSKDANLEIEIDQTKEVSPAILKLVTQKDAASEKAPIKLLSGYGSYGAQFTSTKDAKTNADGIATTTISVLIGDSDINVIGDLPAKNVLAVFKQVF